MRISRKGFLAVLVLFVLAAGLGTAVSNPRPFSAHLLTTFTPPVPGSLGCFDPPTGLFTILGDGQATHLGRCALVATSEIEFLGAGQCVDAVLTAANGDELRLHIDDVATPPDPDGNLSFTGTWYVTGGSGRFDDAEGGGSTEGTANLFAGTGEVFMSGSISY
jgi:hypothetical protein